MQKHDTLYITDLDGTLLQDDQTLSETTISYLSKAIRDGLNFTYATARSINSSRFVIDALDLQLPVILYNGAQIYCPKTQSYIHSAYMESEDFRSYLKILLEDGLDPVVHCLDDDDKLKVYFQSVSNESTMRWINSRLANGDKRYRVTTDFSEIDASKVVELMVVAPHEQLMGYEEPLKASSSVSYILSEDIYM